MIINLCEGTIGYKNILKNIFLGVIAILISTELHSVYNGIRICIILSRE